MRPMIAVLGVLAVGLVAVAAEPAAPAAPEDATVAFAVGAIDGLSPGDSFFYRMVVDANWSAPYAGSVVMGTATLYARVVVTDVFEAGDALRTKARIDGTDQDGKVAEHGRDVYRLLLARKGERVNAVIDVNFPLPSHLQPATLGETNWLPCPLLGYPAIAGVPKEGAAAPVVKGQKLGAIAVRYTPSYDAKDGLAKVKVEYFRSAREDDREKGRQMLYLDPDPGWLLFAAARGEGPLPPETARLPYVPEGLIESQDYRLLTSPPMGVEAAPLLTAIGEFPRDKYGDPHKYRVSPVTTRETEELEWEPGAAFPKHVVRRDENGHVLFDLTLVRTEKVALDEPAATPAPEQTLPTSLRRARSGN